MTEKNIREREYEIGEKDSPTQILKTGYLFTCVAFYGVDRVSRRTFLCHIDAHARGIRRIVDDLKTRSNGNLSNFDLYVTSGVSRLERFLLVLAVVLFCWFRHAGVRLASVVDAVVIALAFGPMALGYIQLIWYFGRRPKGKFKLGLFRRVEVTVDASKDVQENPTFEREPSSETKMKFGIRDGSCVFARLKRTSDIEAAEDAYSQSRLSAGPTKH